MRICHLGKFYPPAPGGIETHLQTLARAQRALGLDVQVLCMNHEKSRASVELDHGVDVQRFNPVAAPFHLQLCPQLIRAIRHSRAEILHMQVPNPAMILHVLAARPAQPLVVTYQSDIVRQRLRAALFRPLERKFYKRVVKILPTSPPYAAGSEFLQRYSKKTEILPMGIDLEPYLNPSIEHRDKAAELIRSVNGPIWLACGRLVYYKGLINAVRALAAVPGTLIIIGSGPEFDALNAEIKALKLESRVLFAGNLPYQDIIPYYLAAHALWFPSNARSEAFGLVQVEAMACACPVINTAIPGSGVAWVSPHEISGLTIPMNDPAALAAAAMRLLDDASLRQRLGAAGRARAKSEFDHMTMARRCIQIYEDVLKPVQMN